MQYKDPEVIRQEIELAWNIHIAEEETEARIRRKWLLFYFEHQDRKCAYCRVPLVIGKVPNLEDRQATIDHILPRSRGGEDTPNNTLAACQFCNALKASTVLSEFLISADLIDRILNSAECPQRVSLDPSSKYHNAKSISRGIAVKVDGKEFFNVYEYCVPENWVRLKINKTKNRDGQPMTVLKRGHVSVIFSDVRNHLGAMKDSSVFINDFKNWLSERPKPL